MFDLQDIDKIYKCEEDLDVTDSDKDSSSDVDEDLLPSSDFDDVDPWGTC